MSPSFVLWSKFDQRRFTDTVEKLTAVVNDLVDVNVQLQIRLQALEAKQARKRKAGPQQEGNGHDPAAPASTP